MPATTGSKSALWKALHKADYAKYPIMESSRCALGQVVGGERIGRRPSSPEG